MNAVRNLCLVAVVAAGLFPTVTKADEPRQKYGEWKRAEHYWYRSYNFKPTPDSEYKQHIVIAFHKDRRFYYYWNPEAKVFWGRAPVEQGHCKTYSMLAKEDQKGSLKDIPETAFPKPTTPPTIPQESVEKVKDPNAPQLALPPDEPPPSFTSGSN